MAWGSADLLLKLEAPTVAELRRMRRGVSIAALFHAESTPDVVSELLVRDITAYSFEYVQDDDGIFPLMTATGEIAGQMAVIYAAYHLRSHLGGSGISLPACAWAPAARVAIIGYGNVGKAAAKTALALGAEVTVYTRHQPRGDQPQPRTAPKLSWLSDPRAADGLAQADVIIGALRISTFDTPAIVTTDIVRRMRKGPVIADVTAGFGAGYIRRSARSPRWMPRTASPAGSSTSRYALCHWACTGPPRRRSAGFTCPRSIASSPAIDAVSLPDPRQQH